MNAGFRASLVAVRFEQRSRKNEKQAWYLSQGGLNLAASRARFKPYRVIPGTICWIKRVLCVVITSNCHFYPTTATARTQCPYCFFFIYCCCCCCTVVIPYETAKIKCIANYYNRGTRLNAKTPTQPFWAWVTSEQGCEPKTEKKCFFRSIFVGFSRLKTDFFFFLSVFRLPKKIETEKPTRLFIGLFCFTAHSIKKTTETDRAIFFYFLFSVHSPHGTNWALFG